MKRYRWRLLSHLHLHLPLPLPSHLLVDEAIQAGSVRCEIHIYLYLLPLLLPLPLPLHLQAAERALRLREEHLHNQDPDEVDLARANLAGLRVLQQRLEVIYMCIYICVCCSRD